MDSVTIRNIRHVGNFWQSKAYATEIKKYLESLEIYFDF